MSRLVMSAFALLSHACRDARDASQRCLSLGDLVLSLGQGRAQ